MLNTVCADYACFFSGAFKVIRMTTATARITAEITNGMKKDPVAAWILPPRKGPQKPATPQAVKSRP